MNLYELTVQLLSKSLIEFYKLKFENILFKLETMDVLNDLVYNFNKQSI